MCGSQGELQTQERDTVKMLPAILNVLSEELCVSVCMFCVCLYMCVSGYIVCVCTCVCVCVCVCLCVPLLVCVCVCVCWAGFGVSS